MQFLQNRIGVRRPVKLPMPGRRLQLASTAPLRTFNSAIAGRAVALVVVGTPST